VERERPLLARTAAGYVRARAGQPRPATLAPDELRLGGGPGLVVVGSHVPTTSRQLAALIADPPAPLELLEVSVADAMDPRRRRALLRAMVARAAAALDRGVIPLIATSRDLVAPSPSDPTGLRLGTRVSHLLAAIVRELEPRPAWIVAKGGITSSDVASLALGARTAMVVGPVLPGVPAWRVRRRGRRSVLLVVFPGNVGDDMALHAAVGLLAAAAGCGRAGPVAGAAPAAHSNDQTDRPARRVRSGG
jgi:uncharacterized protein YgbK (DUF1537 family)